MINIYSVKFNSEDIINNLHQVVKDHCQDYPERDDIIMLTNSEIENMLRYYYNNNFIKEYSCLLYKKEQSFSSSGKEVSSTNYFFYITFFSSEDNENHEFYLTLE